MIPADESDDELSGSELIADVVRAFFVAANGLILLAVGLGTVSAFVVAKGSINRSSVAPDTVVPEIGFAHVLILGIGTAIAGFGMFHSMRAWTRGSWRVALVLGMTALGLLPIAFLFVVNLFG